MSSGRLAVVLMNLGGPDKPASVRPFLRNLFSDPAIITLPTAFRLPLAALIAATRAPLAKRNYGRIGGASPLAAETAAQAGALAEALSARFPDRQVKCFAAMRYWSPTSEATALEVARFDPSDIVLLPLYPQFSTTTTASSLLAWRRAYHGQGRSHAVCCWYEAPGMVESHAKRILETWEAAGRPKVRLLFSAHGIPERVAAGGDPYPWQVEAGCRAIAARLGDAWDWRICYQSRVGPLRWLGPSTLSAIATAASDGLGVLVDPVAFVSEHVETLVELDIDYAEQARRLGAPVYLRAPAVGTMDIFIAGLADTVERALDRGAVSPDSPACPGRFVRCGRQSSVGCPA